MMRQHNGSSPRGHIVPDLLVNLDKWISLDQLQLSKCKLWRREGV